MFAQLLAEALVGAGAFMIEFVCAAVCIAAFGFISWRFNWYRGTTLSGGPR